MSDPFLIKGPALISFSGGRSSAYMLWRILQAHGGTLPDDVKVTFANTGKEMPQTLDFVRDCGERWGVEIIWLEYQTTKHPKDRWQRVSYETASRKGEPFEAMVNKQAFLPTPAQRLCTEHLKIRPMKNYMASLGFDEPDRVIGIRADEQHRVMRMRSHDDIVMPLATIGITKHDVMGFWRRHGFDLKLTAVDGITLASNCDLCFMKGLTVIKALMRQNPEWADWWIRQEERTGHQFHRDRQPYRVLAAQVSDQIDMGFPDILADDGIVDCFCGDGG